MQVVEQVKRWLSDFVIELGLCPFASKPYLEGSIRYQLIESDDLEKIILSFHQELNHLNNHTHTETTLLIAPSLDTHFDEFLDVFYTCEAYIEQLGLQEDYQLASFHPEYVFASANVDDASNYTNRSPHAIIHILRASSLEMAIKSYGDTSTIPTKNIALMNEMGLRAIESKLKDLE